MSGSIYIYIYSDIINDQVRFKQIFLNLLSNSVKYTFEGEITVSLKIISINDTEFLHTEVKDTGIGISPELIPNLFEMFGCIENPSTQNKTGIYYSKYI